VSATAQNPTACLACRGTGQIISGLGGTPHTVACPWCRGGGERIPGIDAQEHPAEGAAAPEPGAAEAPAA
jgi:DnaJ-class molecular chaperone